MEQDLYTRQMKWREDAKKKVLASLGGTSATVVSVELHLLTCFLCALFQAIENKPSNKDDEECTFQPKKFTKAPQKKFNGTAMEKGMSTHIVRQTKARQTKDTMKSPPAKTVLRNSSLLPVEAVKESNSNRSSLERRDTPSPPSSPNSTSHNTANHDHARQVPVHTFFYYSCDQ